jgi:pyrophosphatase PpaX
LIQVILFDLDGTLLDSEGIAVQANRQGFETVLRRAPTPEEEAGLTGVPVPKVLAEWFPHEGTQVFTEILIYYERHAEQVHPYVGVCEMIADLHRSGYVLGIVSSRKRRYVLRELEAAGLAGFFSVVIGQEDTLDHKPNPSPLLLAVEQLGITPAYCGYVGDQPTDIQAAQAAGMCSVAACWGEGRKERLAACKPTFSCEKPMELVLLALHEWHAEGIEERCSRSGNALQVGTVGGLESH